MFVIYRKMYPMTMGVINDDVMRHRAWLGQLLNDDRNTAVSTCDLVLESEGKQFKVHKSVVMLVSNYFRRMFTIEMKEKYEGIVKMQKIPHQRLANIIQFIYSGKIEITEENMFDVLDDAEYTEIQVLKAKCCAFLLNIVSAENSLKLRAYAQRYNLKDLIEKTNQLIAENFATVVQHEDFMQLDVDDVSAILKHRNRNCEESIFTGIVKWVKHDPLQREELFVNLFSQLHLSSMSVDFLPVVLNENLVKSNIVCLKLFAEASLRINKRFSGNNLSNKFLLIGGEDTEHDCVLYDVITRQAKQLPKLIAGRYGATSVIIGNKVFVIGGTDHDDNPQKSCEMLDLNEPTRWVAMPDMFEAGGYCGSALLQGHIYVTGGSNGQAMSSCEKFDIHNKKWTRISDMLHARCHHKTVVCNNLLYCIGGESIDDDRYEHDDDEGEDDEVDERDEDNNIDKSDEGDKENDSCENNDGDVDDWKSIITCECYDMTSEKWSEIAPMNQARSFLASVVLNGNIYAIGGTDGLTTLSTVEKYIPGANKWENIASLQHAREYASACVIGNKIFVIGGYDGEENLNSVEVYDPTSDVWTIVFNIENPVYGAAVVGI